MTTFGHRLTCCKSCRLQLLFSPMPAWNSRSDQLLPGRETRKALQNSHMIDAHSSIREPAIAPMGWKLRSVCLLSGLLCLGLLVTARILSPASEGLGTHQQLGLPPCTSIVLFDAPCPACGMTTSWALLTRGEFLAAVNVNAGGAMLALIAMAYVPASCYFFATGRSTRNESFSFWLATFLLAAIVAAAIQWSLRG